LHLEDRALEPELASDPTENGLYHLKLVATDINGVTTSTIVTVAARGLAKVGAFTLSFIDLAIPVSGIPITVTRTYDSRIKTQRDFGIGWSLRVAAGSFEANRPVGDGILLTQSPRPPFNFPCQVVQEIKPHVVTVQLSDREWYSFAPQVVNTAATVGGCFGDVQFAQIDGLAPGASLAILGNTGVIELGDDQLLDDSTFALFNPQQVELTTADGRTVDLDAQLGITALRDTNGNSISIGAGGIVSSTGESVTFARDAAGRIEQITDPAGGVLGYAYSPAGDLAEAIDRAGNRTSFFYDAQHNLLEIHDPLGNRAVKSVFDSSGRLVQTIDALGNAAVFQHDLANRRETITNRLGYTYFKDYDASGNVVAEIYPGSPTVQVSRTFDSRGNALTETNELGQTTRRTFDAQNHVLTETDALGQTSTTTYSSLGWPTTHTDPRGLTVVQTYDALGNELSVKDAAGLIWPRSHDPQGNLTRDCDPLGACRSKAYDSSGNLIRDLDRRGSVQLYAYDLNKNLLTITATRSTASGIETDRTSFGYDPDGRLLTTTNPDGSTTSAQYDARGLVVARTDGLGHRTQYTFDAIGHEVGRLYADGTSESTIYDADGHPVSKTDRLGTTTTMTYDSRGRLLSSSVGGLSRQYAYDAAGHLIAVTDRRGFTTSYTYDADGRLASTTDPLGHVTTQTYDGSGNLATVQDAKSRTTRYTYDLRSLLVRTDYVDGSFESAVYDAATNLTSETDQAGRVTTNGFDGEGNLVSVTNANNETWTLAYDERGLLISEADPNQHVLRFTRDSLGRETSRQFNQGPQQLRSWDANGKLIALQNFSGVTTEYRYDSNGFVAQRLAPDGTVTFTNNPTGRRSSATDSRGTTSYSYDSMDRLVSVSYPDASALTYGYDPEGNLLSAASGGATPAWTTTYQYDRAGRRTSVTSGAQAFALAYDETNQLASIGYPNGLAATYSYDSFDRVASIALRNAQAATLFSETYGRSPTGNVLSIAAADGTSRQYGYDRADRVTSETILSGATPLSAESFVYDGAGNRTSRSLSLSGGAPAGVSSSYDAQDRLLATGTVSYAWDTDGRMLSRSGGDGFTLGWDSQDRLQSIGYGDGAVEQVAYDADGNAVASTFTPAGGTSHATKLLEDPQSRLSEVATDVDGATNTLVAQYVRAGDLLLATNRPSGTRYYHSDQLGSVRALSDASGNITDTYSYEAFGQLRGHSGADPNPYLFAGQRFDPRQRLSYNRARWMDPAAGRFLSIDPEVGEPGLQAYPYAESNPLALTDPSGRIPAVCVSSIPDGLAYHALLYAHFVVLGPPPDSVVDPLTGMSEPARLANRAISTILFLKGLGRRWHLLVRPDLTQRALNEFYEIKVDNRIGISSGVKQLAVYEGIFTLVDPYSFWHPGTTYEPPPIIGNPAFSITEADVRVDYESFPGLVLYCPRDSNLIVTALGASLLGVAILNSLTGIGVMTGLLGGGTL
jgi:RHS repeat-associated protein